SASLSLAAGASGSSTLNVASPASAVNGAYTVSVTAKNSGATSFSASASAAYGIANPPPGGSGGTFADVFNRADSTNLGVSWTAVSGSLAVDGNMTKTGVGATGNQMS